jgi:hypothetical protein
MATKLDNSRGFGEGVSAWDKIADRRHQRGVEYNRQLNTAMTNQAQAYEKAESDAAKMVATGHLDASQIDSYMNRRNKVIRQQYDPIVQQYQVQGITTNPMGDIGAQFNTTRRGVEFIKPWQLGQWRRKQAIRKALHQEYGKDYMINRAYGDNYYTGLTGNKVSAQLDLNKILGLPTAEPW